MKRPAASMDELQGQLEAILTESAREAAARCVVVCKEYMEEEKRKMSATASDAPSTSPAVNSVSVDIPRLGKAWDQGLNPAKAVEATDAQFDRVEHMGAAAILRNVFIIKNRIARIQASPSPAASPRYQPLAAKADHDLVLRSFHRIKTTNFSRIDDGDEAPSASSKTLAPPSGSTLYPVPPSQPRSQQDSRPSSSPGRPGAGKTTGPLMSSAAPSSGSTSKAQTEDSLTNAVRAPADIFGDIKESARSNSGRGASEQRRDEDNEANSLYAASRDVSSPGKESMGAGAAAAAAAVGVYGNKVGIRAETPPSGTMQQGRLSPGKTSTADMLDRIQVGGPGSLTPWWIQHGVKPAGPEVDKGGWKAISFSKEQQDKFGIDEEGKITNQIRFDVAISSMKYSQDRSSSPLTSSGAGAGAGASRGQPQLEAARVYAARNAELGRCLAEITADLQRACIISSSCKSSLRTSSRSNSPNKGPSREATSPGTPAR